MDQGDARSRNVLKTMRERVSEVQREKIRPQDLAGAAGPPDEDTT